MGRLASLSPRTLVLRPKPRNRPPDSFEAQTAKPGGNACPASRQAPLDLADAISTVSTCLHSIILGVDHPWLRPASSGPSAASLLKLALHHPWSIGTTLSLRPSPRTADRHAASTTCATQAKAHVTRHGVVNHSSHKGSEPPLVPQVTSESAGTVTLCQIAHH